MPRQGAINLLGSGLSATDQYTDALRVKKAELAMMERIGAPEANILPVLTNLANSYTSLGRLEQALILYRDVYSRRLKLNGEEHERTLLAANNYASSLADHKHFRAARSLFRKILPVAPRVLGESNDLTLRMRRIYAETLYEDGDATLDDLREAVKTLEELAPTARRVLGSTHPDVAGIERGLRMSRAELGSREMTAAGRGTTRADDVRSLCEAVAAMASTQGPGDARS